jgi:hypothetical protein
MDETAAAVVEFRLADLDAVSLEAKASEAEYAAAIEILETLENIREEYSVESMRRVLDIVTGKGGAA